MRSATKNTAHSTGRVMWFKPAAIFIALIRKIGSFISMDKYRRIVCTVHTRHDMYGPLQRSPIWCE